MSIELNTINEQENLIEYPKIRREAKGRFIILPDQHGCTLKLIFSLVKEGIFEIEPGDYAKIVGICKRAEKLSQEDAEEFNTILRDKIKVRLPHKLHLLEDLLADRGFLGNDYLNVKVIEKLGEAGVNYGISWANHGAEALCRLQGAAGNIDPMQTQSFGHMVRFLLRYPKEEHYRHEVENIINRYYKPKLEILSGAIIPANDSSLPPTFLHLSHAPTDVTSTQANLAKYFTMEERKHTKLTDVIQERMAINAQFRLAIEKENFFHDWHTQLKAWECNKNQNADWNTWNTSKILLSPLIIPAWNKGVPTDEVYEDIEGHQVIHVHGHVGNAPEIPSPKKRINLDANNWLGHLQHHQQKNGNYRVYSCTGAQTLEEYLGASVTSKTPVQETKPKLQESKALPLAKLWQAQKGSEILSQARSENWDAVFFLLEYQPKQVNYIDPNKETAVINSASLLQYAVQQNNEAAVTKLLELKAEVNLQNRAGYSPLYFCNNETIKAKLIEAGATEAKKCAYLDPQFLVREIQQAPPDNVWDWELAHFLVAEPDCPVNGCNDSHQTVLQQLIIKQKFQLAEKLLQRNDVEVNAEDNQGRTALDYLQYQYAPKLSELLAGKQARKGSGKVSETKKIEPIIQKKENIHSHENPQPPPPPKGQILKRSDLPATHAPLPSKLEAPLPPPLANNDNEIEEQKLQKAKKTKSRSNFCRYFKAPTKPSLHTVGKGSVASSILATMLLTTLEIAANGYEAEWATKALSPELGTLGKTAVITAEDVLIACALIGGPYLLYRLGSFLKASCAAKPSDHATKTQQTGPTHTAGGRPSSTNT